MMPANANLTLQLRREGVLLGAPLRLQIRPVGVNIMFLMFLRNFC